MTPIAEPQAPPPSNPRARVRYALVALTVSAVILGSLLAALGWLSMGYPDRQGPGRGRVVELDLESGDSLEAMAHKLAAHGALADPALFALYARMRGAGSRLRSGIVLVYDTMSPRELMQRVAHGYGSASLRVVIPEGFSRFDIAARLARWGVCQRAAFLEATVDAALLAELGITAGSAEGWLFPDTYMLRDDTDPRVLVGNFVANARRRMAPVFEANADGVRRLKDGLGFGRTQIVTLASIVEKEAALPSEQPMISAVFLNRLRVPEFMPKRLQADPTVAYGCAALPTLPSCSSFNGRDITRQMLSDADNPYNTYRSVGLPPGPICNPGLGALRAVLAPATHDYLYFVAAGRGRHKFSRTLAEHQTAVDQRHSTGAP